MTRKIAFLGTGLMGAPMANRLLDAGFDVTVWNRNSAKSAPFAEKGAKLAQTAAGAAGGADIVITMLTDGPAVRDVLFEQGVAAVLKKGSTVIDMSSISPDFAREHAERLEAIGVNHIDAPVSGGVVGAEAGTLAFMVGGEDADFNEALPLLEVMGGRIVHCGGAGLGQAAKVCNNMVLAVSQIAVAEAFVLGEQLGLTHEALYDVVANASGQCWAITTNCPVPGPVPTSPANRDYEPGFAGFLMNKDLGLAEQAISLTGVDAKMGMLARSIYAEYAAGEGAHRDFSGIINTIRENSRA